MTGEDGEILEFTFWAYRRLSKEIRAKWDANYGRPYGAQEQEEDPPNPVEIPFGYGASLAATASTEQGTYDDDLEFDDEMLPLAEAKDDDDDKDTTRPLALPSLIISDILQEHCAQVALAGIQRKRKALSSRIELPCNKHLVWNEIHRQVCLHSANPSTGSLPFPWPKHRFWTCLRLSSM